MLPAVDIPSCPRCGGCHGISENGYSEVNDGFSSTSKLPLARSTNTLGCSTRELMVIQSNDTILSFLRFGSA